MFKMCPNQRLFFANIIAASLSISSYVSVSTALLSWNIMKLTWIHQILQARQYQIKCFNFLFLDFMLTCNACIQGFGIILKASQTCCHTLASNNSININKFISIIRIQPFCHTAQGRFDIYKKVAIHFIPSIEAKSVVLSFWRLKWIIESKNNFSLRGKRVFEPP